MFICKCIKFKNSTFLLCGVVKNLDLTPPENQDLAADKNLS